MLSVYNMVNLFLLFVLALFLRKMIAYLNMVNGTMLRWTIERDLPYCKLKVLFRSKCRLNTLFQFKDPLEKKNCSGIIYRCTCSSCKVTYFGKAFHHFHHFYNRAAEHMGISSLTGKRLKNVNSLQYLTIYCSVIVP